MYLSSSGKLCADSHARRPPPFYAFHHYTIIRRKIIVRHPIPATSLSHPILLAPFAHAVEDGHEGLAALGKAVLHFRWNLRVFRADN